MSSSPQRPRRRLRFAPARRLPFAVLSMLMTTIVAVSLFQPWEASAASAASAVRTQAAAADGLFVPSTDPAGVVTQFTDGGPAVQAAARQALLKGGQSIEDFIASGQHEAIAEDYRLIALRLSLVGGHVVREKAEAALTANDPDALRAFVTDGWKSAWALDDRAAAFVLADRGTPTVKREANKALDSADPNAVSNFMLVGQHNARIIDDRAATYALATTGSPSVVAAAEAALDATLPDGSDDTQAVADFLRYGQFVAGARDAESATIAQLTTQAIAANTIAQDEKLKADEASAQAVLSARLAREAAQRAADQAHAAQGNAVKASAAASRAAALAGQAAAAADTAVQAAAAAHQAMNASMAAAGTAAAAAARANRAAASADSAAASAAGQAGQAAAARTAAEQARTAAAMADTYERAASEARSATNAANRASKAAGAAAGYAGEAAGFATEASQASGVSSAAAAQARGAAAKANAAKDRAASATARVDRLAAETSDVAEQARAAAAQAAVNARAAATEADTAAANASISQGAAARATASSAKAAAAATAATEAVELAKSVFTLARKADKERLAAEEEYGMAQAALAAEDEAEAKKIADAAKKEAADAVAESSTFLKKITAEDANLQELLPEARSALLALITSGTPWIAAAAEQAVVGSDEAIVEFFSNGYDLALEQDQWDQATTLLYGSNVQLQEEAYDIVENGEEYVADFLTERVPEVRDLENRQTAFVLATNGGPTVQREANRALDSDDPALLAKFIATGQYDALEIDQRAAAFALASSGGPEVQAAANVALEGSQDDLKKFLAQGQFDAAKRDQDTAAHVAQMQSMLHLADAQAASAREAAALAEQSAAIARKAAAEAQDAANRARQSALDAQGWATKAQTSANQATESENQARQSSQRAHQALNAATADAKKANGFAAQATSSAHSASASAARANDAASRAATSATNAGADAEAAAKAATDALDIAASMQRAEEAADNFPPPAGKEGELTQAQIDAAFALGGDAEVKRLKDAHALTQPNALLDFIVKEGGKVLLDLVGVTDIMDCVTKGDIGSCFMALVGLVPIGKLAKFVEAIPLIAKLVNKVIGFVEKVGDAVSLLKKNKTKVDDLAGSCTIGGNFTPGSGVRQAIGPTDYDACGAFKPGTSMIQPTERASVKGKLGEQAGGVDPTTPKVKLLKDDYPELEIVSNRIPEEVGANFVKEVKNTKTLTYTAQLRDMVKFTEALGKDTFEIVTRPDVEMAPILKSAICDSTKDEAAVQIVVKYFGATVDADLIEVASESFCKKKG